MLDLSTRLKFAEETCRAAGSLALEYFSKLDVLVIDSKGAQDWVSEADRDVETFIRQKISAAWPDDGVVGEEHPTKVGTSGFDWVIDPIDGTTNYVNGIPVWTVVLAGVSGTDTQLGVIHEPNTHELFAAQRGGGATLNGARIQVASGKPLGDGTVAVGHSNRLEAAHSTRVIEGLLDCGAMYHRNASGALSLAYVAAGRILGYVEEHMNAWDCLAGQLLVEEAGGIVEEQDVRKMIQEGGRVIVGTPDVFETILTIADQAWRH